MFYFFVGIFGRGVELVTNSVNLFYEDEFVLQKYRIYFNPNVETNIKKEMLNKHKSFLGKYVLDGDTMYSFRKHEPEVSLF